MKHVKSFIVAIFWAIPEALFIAGMIWFAGFILRNPVTFPDMFYYVYLALLVSNLLGMIKSLFLGWRQMRQVMRRFGVSKRDAAEGLFKYGLNKSRQFNEWTTRDFKQSLATARAVVDALSE